MVGPKGWSQPCCQSLLSRPGFVPEPWCVELDGSPEPVGGAHAVRGGHGCPCHWAVWLRFSGPGLGQDLRPNPVPTGTEPLVLGTSPVLLHRDRGTSGHPSGLFPSFCLFKILLLSVRSYLFWSIGPPHSPKEEDVLVAL